MNLSVSSVSFTYPTGVQALQDIDLVVEAGETVAIIGENGAGKTTLAKHLNGLLKPDQGRVRVGDWDTGDRSVAQLARRVGFAFQNPDEQLFARTVREELSFGPRNFGHDDRIVAYRVEQALAMVGLAASMEDHPYDLQAAERKLITLAAVLAMQTPIIILDEPTMGQDARGAETIGCIIADLSAQGRTILTISHDIDFCAEHFQRVVVMAGGRIIADGPASDVLTHSSLLAESQVEPPQLVRLAQAIALPRAPLTTAGFLQQIQDRRKPG